MELDEILRDKDAQRTLNILYLLKEDNQRIRSEELRLRSMVKNDKFYNKNSGILPNFIRLKIVKKVDRDGKEIRGGRGKRGFIVVNDRFYDLVYLAHSIESLKDAINLKSKKVGDLWIYGVPNDPEIEEEMIRKAEEINKKLEELIHIKKKYVVNQLKKIQDKPSLKTFKRKAKSLNQKQKNELYKFLKKKMDDEKGERQKALVKEILDKNPNDISESDIRVLKMEGELPEYISFDDLLEFIGLSDKTGKINEQDLNPNLILICNLSFVRKTFSDMERKARIYLKTSDPNLKIGSDAIKFLLKNMGGL